MAIYGALYSVSQVGFGAVEYAAAQIGGSFVDNAYSVIRSVANNFLNIQGSALTIFLTIDSILTIYFWFMLGASYYCLAKTRKVNFSTSAPAWLLWA